MRPSQGQLLICMRKGLFALGLVLALIVVLLIISQYVRAGGTVGDGTPGSCTESALDAALVSGGNITFNCGPDPVTVTVDDVKVIGQNTSIDGSGKITLSGGSTTRIFHIFQNATLSLAHLTLSNGYESPGSGGAIYNSGHLNLDHTIFISNCAPAGGAILNNGMLTVTECVFLNNAAEQGGAINNTQNPVLIRNSLFVGNHASEYGGGIINVGAMTVTASTFSGNSAAEAGGGIFSALEPLMVTRSTFMDNSAGDLGGGGIWTAGSALTVINSTLSGNSSSGSGGALHSGGPSVVTNTTFFSNTTGGSGGGNIYFAGFSIALKNTIVANGSPNNCSGTVPSRGHNLESGDSCHFAATGDITNTNPLLDSLAYNFGRTLNHALLPGSPAIDTGTNDGCPATDQRGFARPQNGVCDIGAYEFIDFVASIWLPLVLR